MTEGVTDTEVIVIGTGFSGLGLAIRLKRAGKRDFVVLDRAGDVGGTWRDNTYPGAACDIQSHLYSFSFRPNPNWSRVYATQPEIWKYLQDSAQEEGIRPHIRFHATVTRADWHEDQGRWIVETTNGTYRAPSLVSAAGHLSDPSYPDIEGLNTFTGQLFHSARWDHSVKTEGMRIGVIGTGASAIQIVPELARVAEHLTVFQRSAPYVIPRRDHIYSDAEKGMFARMPKVAQSLRDDLFWGNESRFPQRRMVPAFLDQIRSTALGHLSASVGDEGLRSRLTPDYQIGCKRILISNDYYPALQQANVSLEASGIAAIDETGVITRSGEHVDLDILVVATGFEAAELPIAELIHGKDGELLAEHWRDGGKAFACTAVAGFPNLFVMLGPNTGLGAGSILYMVETQIGFIEGALEYIAETGSIVEPDASSEDSYVAGIYKRSEGSVWTAGGCESWYLHPRSHRLTTLWPDFMSQFRLENGTFRADDYQVRPNPRPLVPAGV